MPRDELSGRERAVLFALLAAARQVSNPDLEKLVGIRLDGRQRRALNDRKLVESVKLGRAYAHELTDAGWRWCAGELAAGQDGRGPSGGRGGSLERAHYLVFGMFARYLDVARLSLADIAEASGSGVVGAPGLSGGGDASGGPDVGDVGGGPDVGDVSGAGDLAARIEAGYRALTPVPGEFVRLRELRLRLADVPRPAVDAALSELYTGQRINLIPQSNQQALTDADRESALRIGGEHKHLISIERWIR